MSTYTVTIDSALARAARDLAGRSDSPRLDAQLLLGASLGMGRAALITDGGRPLEAAALRDFEDLIARRRGGAPVAYLTGRREFWSLDLRVTPAVLVPRPETETLVAVALAALPAGARCSLLDLGTGSGAIALAVAHERPLAAVTGTDLSPAALDVARDNAHALGLTHIVWREGDWFDAVPGGRFDVIVSNPPYVAAGDPSLAALGAEPPLALTPGPTGLEAFAAIAAGAGRHLHPGGRLIFEHGADQAAGVAALLADRGFAAIETRPDHAGLPRVTLGILHPST